MKDEKSDAGAEERAGLADIPKLLRKIIDRALELANARFELIVAEIREEASQRVRRIPHVVIPAVFLILGFGLLNVGLVSWLAEALGMTAAAFTLAGIYILIGVVGIWWFLRTGGLNPPDRPEGKESKPLE